MLFSQHLVILRGGGDLATGVAYRLHAAGFPIIVLELERPLVVRRKVALATAVLQNKITIENMHAQRAKSVAHAMALIEQDIVPVLVAPQLSVLNQSKIENRKSKILIDARMAKRNIDTHIDQAELVISLGPGFTAGVDCHAVIETMRGHSLGRVIWDGAAIPNTGTPGIVAGKGTERVLRAPAAGEVDWRLEIGNLVEEGQIIGDVSGNTISAPFSGVLRGLIAPGTDVAAGYKIGDLDARADAAACFTISDKALSIGGGVLEAILTHLNRGLKNPVSYRNWVFNNLPTAFGLKAKDELIAIVGGGGKTSLMFALADELMGRRIISTTTRIFAAQMKLAQETVEFTAEDAESVEKKISATLDRREVCLVVGTVQGEKAMGVPPELVGQWLAQSDVDFVLVEADGSRMRPIKAPAAHEPVIPSATTLVVPVVGIDALAAPLDEVAHRPELAAKLLQWSVSSEQLSVFSNQLSVKDVARLITHADGGLKGVPDGARVVPFINKVETAVQLHAARQIGKNILQEPRIDRVVIGAVKTAQPVREVQTRVTAVVLAAGQGKRMSQTKQLLPWGNTTVLGQTIRNLKQTAVTNICVVSGHEAAKVEAIAAAEQINCLHNPDFATGEMISSLQTAVRQLSSQVTAVLVMLADQPMVQPETIDQILAAYWQGKGDLIAPVYQGQRGNPVLIGRTYFEELLRLAAEDAPRTLLQRHPDKLHLLPVNSNTILRDLDNLEQYEQERPFA